MNESGCAVAPLIWHGDAENGWLEMLDQTQLPTKQVAIECRTAGDVFEGIRMLRVRGAPAIGVAGAYGLILAAQQIHSNSSRAFLGELTRQADWLNSSRPTAVNLSWGLGRLIRLAEKMPDSLSLTDRRSLLLEDAKAIAQEDKAMCTAMAQHGLDLIPPGAGILTHCNTGVLATAGEGTALAVIYAAHRAGKNIRVYADETRPLLQGSRLTAWELKKAGVPVTLICDNMAAMVMRQGKIQAVLVGADRIAANGDTANKIGTYTVAVLARHHGIPFHVVAPTSSFDLGIESGTQIPIEERAAQEVICGYGKPTAPEDVDVYNPAFDVTPGDLITSIITENGIIRPVTKEIIEKTLGESWKPGL